MVYFVEDDIFSLTLGFDLDMNCVVLVQLTLLLVELIIDDVIVSIMNIFEMNYSTTMLVLY